MANEARFTSITALAYCSDGHLYVGDGGTIRLVEPDGYTGFKAGMHPQQPAPDLSGAAAGNAVVRPGEALVGTVLVQAAMGWPFTAIALEVDGQEVGRSADGLLSVPWDTRTVGNGTHTWRLRGFLRGGARR